MTNEDRDAQIASIQTRLDLIAQRIHDDRIRADLLREILTPELLELLRVAVTADELVIR